MMRFLKLFSTVSLLLVLAACVTINIYFPAAEAEEAAEIIVEDILGKEPAKQDKTDAPDKGASRYMEPQQQFSFSLIDWLLPAAHAAQPDFDVSSPKVRKIQAGMKQRHSSLAKYYSSGAVGFTNQGLISIRDAKAVSLKEKNRVKSLVASENKDRNALYRAIADANGHPEWEPDIRATFAKKWVQKANKGWWYQTSRGGWKQK